MARPLESCLICGTYPCTCNAKKPKAVAKPKKKAEAPPAPAPRKFKTTGAPVSPVMPSRFKDKVHEPERDLSLENALRAVRDLVSPRDRGRIDAALRRSYPQRVAKRLAEWKARNANSSTR